MRLMYILWLTIVLLALPPAYAQQYTGSYSQEESTSYLKDNSVVEYSQYYSFSSSVQDGQVNRVEKYVASGIGPSYIYMGADRKRIPYSDMQYYYSYGRGNYLWIEGEDSWTDYAKVPKDSILDLIAITSSAGYAYLYDIYPNGKTFTSTMAIYPYSRIKYYADTPGKHTLYFVINNRASNQVVIDVQETSPFLGFGYNWARVNLVSDWKGYDIFIDDVFALTEGTGGVPDGVANFPIRGGGVHKITISLDGQVRSTEQYFETDKVYNINL